MEVISIAAHKERKRAEIRKEILEAVGREFDKVHEAHIQIARERLISYAGVISGAYSQTPEELERRKRQLHIEQ